MIEFGFPLIVSAFLAGVAMFFAPCTLPLVPAFLATVAGVSPAMLKEGNQGASIRWRIFKTAVAFVIGFSTVFILLGVGVTAIGQIPQIRMWIQRFAGVAMMLFGATLLGLIRLPSFATKLPLFSGWREKLPFLHSAFVGVAFGLAWSPCIGPILGSVLFLAAGSATIGQGTFLLFIFALGQAVPFILSALFIGHLMGSITRWAKVAQIVNRIAGAVLVIFGILLMSNLWFHLLGWLGAWATHLPGYETFVNQFL